MQKQFFLLLFSVFALFSTEQVDVLFYLQDAGETYALIPVIEALEEKGIECRILAAGVAEGILANSGLPQEKIKLFSDFGVQFDADWQRSYRICDCYVARLTDEIAAIEVVAGVAYEAQGQVLEAYQNRGAKGLVFWDNFNADGQDPYFETARSVAQRAQTILVPAIALEGAFPGKTAIAVGHPSLDAWKAKMESLDRTLIRARQGLLARHKAALFIGGYGSEYEDSFRIYLDGAAKTDEFVFLFHPHPKSDRTFEKRLISESGSSIWMIEDGTSALEAVAMADLVLCHQSTVAFQALAAGKPVLHVLPQNSQYTSLPLEKGMAMQVRSAEDFPEALAAVMGRAPSGFYQTLGVPPNAVKNCADAIAEGVQK